MRHGLRSWGVTMLVLLRVWLGSGGLGWAVPTSEVNEAESKAEALQRDADRLDEDGRTTEATPLVEKACSILRKQLGTRSTKFAECLNNLGEHEHVIRGSAPAPGS
jgi:hypothetical protein